MERQNVRERFRPIDLFWSVTTLLLKGRIANLRSGCLLQSLPLFGLLFLPESDCLLVTNDGLS